MIAATLVLLLAGSAQEAEGRVREALGVLEQALVAQDESLGDLFDLTRLVREMELSGAIPDEGARYRGVRRLEQHLGGMALAPGTLRGGWEKLRPLSVRLNAAGDEAEALCRVAIGGRKGTFRVWLVRDGASWKAFDLENLDGSFRLSVIGLQYTPGVRDDEERYALRDGVMTFQRGAIQMAEGKPEAAREAMALARQAGPPEAVLAWIDFVDGRALLDLGDPDGALRAADRVLARRKDFALAHRLKADSHAGLGEFEKSAASAREYLRLVGDDAEAWTFVGDVLRRLGRTAEAMEAYRKGAEADDEDVESRLNLGRMLVERGKGGDARRPLVQAAREEDGFEEAVDLLDRAGEHAGALEAVEGRLQRAPADAEVLFRWGRALRKLGRLEEAERVLRAQTAERETGLELLLVLAQAGRDVEALERMKSVAAGGHPESRYARAFVHAAAGRGGKALEELRPLLAEDGDPMDRIDTEPVFARLRGEPEARTVFERARAGRDFMRAIQSVPAMDWEGVLKLSRARLAAAPEDGWARFYAGWALRRLKRLGEAEVELKAAERSAKDPQPFRGERVRVLAALGRLDEALAVAESFRAAGGPPEESGRLRAAAFALAGKLAEADAAVQDLLKKHPRSHWIVAGDEDLRPVLARPTVQESIRKARAAGR